MKKSLKQLVLTLSIIFCVCVCVCFIANLYTVRAEELITQFEDEEISQELDKVKNWVMENVNKETISRIIIYCTTGSSGIGLIVVLIKYFKEKKTTRKDIEEIVEEVVLKIYTDKDKTEKQEILSSIGKLGNSVDTIIKALVLMQDSTSKGKIALLDLLNVSKNLDIKEVIDTTKQVIEEKIEKNEAVLEAVEEEYKELF